ncbi:MAG TPA: 2-dehydro-3-deoxyphosphogluconate aldolase [Thermoanaerobaculia bacterium]|jgi:2-dehydro-3-deoxyphosphogluconate aldolase/(4S)-4-hydroxy-2-oxoglutarate aldolase
MATTLQIHDSVALSLRRAPIIGVVRTASRDAAAAQARSLAASGVELVEITFTVPGASGLVRELLAGRSAEGPPWFGMGTVTTAARAREAVAAGAEFIVTPNVSAEVAREARQAGLFLVMGALTPTEIVAAVEVGADLVKVYPLPPVGGPAYLSVIRGPLGDVPMLAAGGFGVEEIPAYRQAGATAFGLAAPLLGVGSGEAEARQRIQRAITLARGAQSEEKR